MFLFFVYAYMHKLKFICLYTKSNFSNLFKQVASNKEVILITGERGAGAQSCFTTTFSGLDFILSIFANWNKFNIPRNIFLSNVV